MTTWDVLAALFFMGVIAFCIYVYFEDKDFNLTCIVSGVDGNKYCVRERTKVQDAADLLAKTTTKLQALVDYMVAHYPDQDNVKMLARNFNPDKIMETLPTSAYTAYSENKGEKIAFCLNVTKGDNNELIDEHTLMFVAIHELAHIMTTSIGHKSEFWDNFRFLLVNAKAAGIHEPVDYKKKPTEYCSMKLTDNPYFDRD